VILSSLDPTGAGSEEGGTDPDGNPVELSGRATEVLRRQDNGSWLVVIDDRGAKAER
jgi:ketosteroid isomerase-like protein